MVYSGQLPASVPHLFPSSASQSLSRCRCDTSSLSLSVSRCGHDTSSLSMFRGQEYYGRDLGH